MIFYKEIIFKFYSIKQAIDFNIKTNNITYWFLLRVNLLQVIVMLCTTIRTFKDEDNNSTTRHVDVLLAQ